MKKYRLGLYLVCTLGISLGCDSGPVTKVNLEPPPEGKGFHFETPDFEVPAGVEQQDCYFFKVPGKKDEVVYMNKVEVAQTTGSHHMNIFRVKTIKGLDPANGAVQKAKNGVGECFKSPNWSDWPLVTNSQQDGNVDWEFPEGVANKFTAGDWLMLQTHYVNAATQKTPAVGHVEVNFWTVPKSQVKYELGTLFATKQSIRICKHNKKPTFKGSCQFNGKTPVKVIGANAHFHSRGRIFDMYSWDGKSSDTPPDEDRFYRSETWDDPPMSRSPELDLTIPAKGGIFYTCSYEWTAPPADVGCDAVNAFDEKVYGTPKSQQDCCYTFGGIVEKAEHCNIFVYYYPKIDDINCF